MRWKRSGPPRGQVDSPVLNFGLLAGLSRKQIRESRIETPLNIDLGVFEFEIPDQLQVGFDQESRIIVMADDQKFMVDRSSGSNCSQRQRLALSTRSRSSKFKPSVGSHANCFRSRGHHR